MWPVQNNHNEDNGNTELDDQEIMEDESSRLDGKSKENRIISAKPKGIATNDQSEMRLTQFAELVGLDDTRNQESLMIMGLSPISRQHTKGPALRHQTVDDNAGDVPADLILNAGRNKS